jgi:hypothetical protein
MFFFGKNRGRYGHNLLIAEWQMGANERLIAEFRSELHDDFPLLTLTLNLGFHW